MFNVPKLEVGLLLRLPPPVMVNVFASMSALIVVPLPPLMVTFEVGSVDGSVEAQVGATL